MTINSKPIEQLLPHAKYHDYHQHESKIKLLLDIWIEQETANTSKNSRTIDGLTT